MKTKDFAVFILTYGRADNVITYETLRQQGYTGEIFLVCSDDDKQLNRYKEKYTDYVKVFSKDEYYEKTDTVDNFHKMNIVCYARNAVRDIAEQCGYRYFIVLDDDYSGFYYRIPQGQHLASIRIKNLDEVCTRMFDYMKKAPRIRCLAMGQGGDYIGGVGNALVMKPKRKVMNSFFMDTHRKFLFKGTTNEDVNTYTYYGNKGEIFLTPQILSLVQAQTQKQAGGLTDIYLEQGTYIKSFYTVIVAPSCCKVSTLGHAHTRIHHRLSADNARPCILLPKYKK